MNKFFKLINLFYLQLLLDAQHLVNETQYPAPHNDYTGRTIDEYYGGEVLMIL